MTAPHELQEFVVVDLETTGLSPRTCQIIEVGAVRVDMATGRGRVSRVLCGVTTPCPITSRG